MTTPQKVISEAAAILHRQHLKPLGYLKSASTWVLPVPWPCVINLQLDRGNTAAEASFTLNLGVHAPLFHAALAQPPISGSLKEHDCDVRARLGMLVFGHDHWWKVTWQDDPSALAAELFRHLESHGLPWLESFPDLLALARHFESLSRFFYAAVAFQLAGFPTKAASAMAAAIPRSNPMAIANMRRVALANSIPFRSGT